MAEQHSTQGPSTSGASASNSDSNVVLNIKTLDSQIYNFDVDKNMPVSLFKGKIADRIGLPVGQQRLIFRGKVLKDEHLLSEYHVENGDTLHLVERQPIQPQTSSGDTSGNSGTQGNEGSTGAPRNRIGQISHSVVLGTLNVGDQGDGGAYDITRVIGSVLNSLGIGNQTTANATVGAQNAAPSNASGQAPQANGTEQGQSTGDQNQAQAQFGHPFLSQAFQVPLTASSVPLPSLNMPIPDSLNTISEFITRMEGFLSQNGYQVTPSPSGPEDLPSTELPSNAQGLATAEALSIVLRHAQRLLSGLAAAALSHIAGRLEQEGGSTDGTVRSQIQSDSVQVGLAMQHLGALLLELGRTILLLRMGRSPAEAVVNAGPAVYISPSGPNPIMVQPFPHQTSPIFNGPAVSQPNAGNLGPVGIIGSAPRPISIHIHAGTSLAPIVSAVGVRATGGEGGQGGHNGGPTSGDSGANRVFPMRNVVATAVPSRTATISVSAVPTTLQPTGGVSASQPPGERSSEISSEINEINSLLRNLCENMNTENRTPSGQQENPVVPNSEASGEASGTQMDSMAELQDQEDRTDRHANTQIDVLKSNDESVCLVEPSPSHPSEEPSESSECDVKDAQIFADKSTGTRDVPLGLGGGLQPKKRSRQSKTQLGNGEGGPSGSPSQSEQARTSAQQVIQSLASQSPANMTGSDDVTRGGQSDITGMMSQLLHSPALNGLLSGVAQQTGVGSPDVLRNMLQQFTQNPAMRNTVNQLAQQVDREDFGHMFAGMGTGQDGSLDLSRMFQQMMPVVSQVLGGGGGSLQSEQLRSMVPELLPQFDDRNLSGDDCSFDRNPQDDIQEVVQRIALHRPSQDIFRAVVENAAERSGSAEGELVDGLCGYEDLADQFVEILRRDLRRQLQGGSASGGRLS